MKISEIFLSIDGEGPRAGYLATFIRTFGCPLRCSYCDSLYALEGNDFVGMSIDLIMQEVEELGCKRVTLTGGEPIIQSDALALVSELAANDYEVQIETSGAVDYIPYLSMGNVFVTADWKCPSSGMADRMLRDQVKYLRDIDVLKFVVGSKEDLLEMKEMYDKTAAQIFVSPVFGKIEPKDIVEFVKENRLYDARVQLQLHKYIYPVDMRGV